MIRNINTTATVVDYNTRKDFIRNQLTTQYDAIVAAQPKAKYGGRKSDLDKIFDSQASQLARKGVLDLGQLTESVDDKGRKWLTNKETGEQLFKIVRDPDIKVDKWAEKGKDVKGIAAFSINFDDQGRGVFLPVYEKSTALGGALADLVVPVATAVGAYFGGPAGAAAGSSLGQYATTGEVDPVQAALAAGLTYAGGEIFGGAEAVPPGGVDYSLTAGGADVGGLGFQVPAGEFTGLNLAPDIASEGFKLAADSLAPSLGASLLPVNLGLKSVDYGLLGGTSPDQLATIGETGLLPGTSGEGLVLPEVPALPGMGGGQGLVVPVEGGFVGETGFTPIDATPILGDPGSFINDPEVLGRPVIEDVAGALTVGDALDLISKGSRLASLISGPGGNVGGGLLDGGGGFQPTGVAFPMLPSSSVTRARLPSFRPMANLYPSEGLLSALQPENNLLGYQPNFSLLR